MYQPTFYETIIQSQRWGVMQRFPHAHPFPCHRVMGHPDWEGLLIPLFPDEATPSMTITQLTQCTALPLIGQWSGPLNDLPKAQSMLSDCIQAGLSGVMDPYGHVTHVGRVAGFQSHLHHHVVQWVLGFESKARSEWMQYWLPTNQDQLMDIQRVAMQWVTELPMQFLVVGPHRPPLMSMATQFPNINIIFKDSVSKAMDHLFQSPIDMVYISRKPYDLWSHHAAHLIHDFFPDAHLVLIDESPCPELLIEFFCNGGRCHISPHDWTPTVMTSILSYGLLQWVSRYADSKITRLVHDTTSYIM